MSNPVPAMSQTFVCPVSGKRKVVPGHPGVTSEIVTDDTFFAPVGWGRLVVEIVIPNPEVAERQTARAKEKADALAQIKAMCEDKEVPASVRTSTKKKLASGEVEKEIEMRLDLDARYAAPEQDTVVRRVSYNVLSDEALIAGLAALKNVGFPVEES